MFVDVDVYLDFDFDFDLVKPCGRLGGVGG